MNDVHELSRLLTEAQRQAAANSGEADKLMSELRQALKNGQSTGDMLRDYVIINWGGNAEVEQKMRELQGQLAGRVGQFVLLVEEFSHTARRDRGGFFDQIKQCELRLGVLSGESLDFQGDAWLLPTSSFSHAELPGDATTSAKGKITLEWQEALAFFQGPVPVFSPHKNPDPLGGDYSSTMKIILVAGDVDVAAWFEELHRRTGHDFMFISPEIARLSFLKLAVATGREIKDVPGLKDIAAAEHAKRLTELEALANDYRKGKEQLEDALGRAFQPKAVIKDFGGVIKQIPELLESGIKLGNSLRSAEEVGLRDDGRVMAWRREFLASEKTPVEGEWT